MPSMLKKPAKIKNGIMIISFSAGVGTRQTLLLATPPVCFQPTGLGFPGILPTPTIFKTLDLNQHCKFLKIITALVFLEEHGQRFCWLKNYTPNKYRWLKARRRQLTCGGRRGTPGAYGVLLSHLCTILANPIFAKSSIFIKASINRTGLSAIT